MALAPTRCASPAVRLGWGKPDAVVPPVRFGAGAFRETGATRRNGRSYRHACALEPAGSYEPAVATEGAEPPRHEGVARPPWGVPGPPTGTGVLSPGSSVVSRRRSRSSGLGRPAEARDIRLGRSRKARGLFPGGSEDPVGRRGPGLPKCPEEGCEPSCEGGRAEFPPPEGFCGSYPGALKGIPRKGGRRSLWRRWARDLRRWNTGTVIAPGSAAGILPGAGPSPIPEPIGGGKAEGGGRSPRLAPGKRSRRPRKGPNEDRIRGDNGATERASTHLGKARSSPGGPCSGRSALGGGQAAGPDPPSRDPPRPPRGLKPGAVPRPKTGGGGHHSGRHALKTPALGAWASRRRVDPLNG